MTRYMLLKENLTTEKAERTQHARLDDADASRLKQPRSATDIPWPENSVGVNIGSEGILPFARKLLLLKVIPAKSIESFVGDGGIFMAKGGFSTPLKGKESALSDQAEEIVGTFHQSAFLDTRPTAMEKCSPPF